MLNNYFGWAWSSERASGL